MIIAIYLCGRIFMRILQTVFCVLACLSVAATVPIGIFFDWYCLIPIAAALIFAIGMTVCKNAADPKPKPRADFMNTDEENERINREAENR